MNIFQFDNLLAKLLNLSSGKLSWFMLGAIALCLALTQLLEALARVLSHL